MADPVRLLVVDDDAAHRAMLRTLLSSWGAKVTEAESGERAVALSREAPCDLVLMDVQMAGMDGIAALRAIRSYNPSIPVLIMTAYSNVESAVEALKAGASDYLAKPLDFDVLRLALDQILGRTLGRKAVPQESSGESGRSGRPGPKLDRCGIIGASPPMRKLLDMLAMVAPSEATVLIYGESGTGKELIARALHANSRCAAGPFVAVNCAALSETLLESELFGHERGAFTSADRRREGYFAQADTGTLFLDEIGEIPLSMQVKLLRVIQEREFTRVGGSEPVRVSVRLATATNRDLKREVEEGRFRQDLYFRLNVVILEVPPLRERIEDIPLLAAHFLERFAERDDKPVKGFTPAAMNHLLKYSWPGNVRELENVVERAVVLLLGEQVGARDLPPALIVAPPSPLQREPQAAADHISATTGMSLEALEKQAVLETLAACNGNKSEAARRLGITRKTLLAKLIRYGE